MIPDLDEKVQSQYQKISILRELGIEPNIQAFEVFNEIIKFNEAGDIAKNILAIHRDRLQKSSSQKDKESSKCFSALMSAEIWAIVVRQSLPSNLINVLNVCKVANLLDILYTNNQDLVKANKLIKDVLEKIEFNWGHASPHKRGLCDLIKLVYNLQENKAIIRRRWVDQKQSQEEFVMLMKSNILYLSTEQKTTLFNNSDASEQIANAIKMHPIQNTAFTSDNQIKKCNIEIMIMINQVIRDIIMQATIVNDVHDR